MKYTNYITIKVITLIQPSETIWQNWYLEWYLNFLVVSDKQTTRKETEAINKCRACINCPKLFVPIVFFGHQPRSNLHSSNMICIIQISDTTFIGFGERVYNNASHLINMHRICRRRRRRWRGARLSSLANAPVESLVFVLSACRWWQHQRVITIEWP